MEGAGSRGHRPQLHGVANQFRGGDLGSDEGALGPGWSGSVPSTRPRRPDMSLITAPTNWSGTRMVTSSTGSSRATVPFSAASLSARLPAVWKAASEESTEWALPSKRVTRRSTTGYPAPMPRSIWVRTPFSTLGM